MITEGQPKIAKRYYLSCVQKEKGNRLRERGRVNHGQVTLLEGNMSGTNRLLPSLLPRLSAHRLDPPLACLFFHSRTTRRRSIQRRAAQPEDGEPTRTPTTARRAKSCHDCCRDGTIQKTALMISAACLVEFYIVAEFDQQTLVGPGIDGGVT